MNIAICINTLSAGGAESFVADLAIEYKKQNNQVYVVVHDILDDRGRYLEKILLSNNIVVYNANVQSFHHKLLLPYKYALFFKKKRIELIHSNLEQTDTYVLLSKIFYKKPLIIRTLHSICPFSKYPHFIHKFMFKMYDINFGCGEALRADYAYSDLRPMIHCINNGVRIPNYTKDEIIHIRNKIRNQLGIKSSELLFLQIGTMSPRFGGILTKGHDVMLKSIAKIKSDEFRVLIVGDVSRKNDSTLYDQKLVGDKRIIYVGIVPNTLEYIYASDIILAPSRTEGLPISSIEGVIADKPLICSDIEPFRKFDYDSTVYFNCEDENDLAKKIQYVVKNYSYLLKNALKNTSKYRDEFSMANTAIRYLTAIKNHEHSH